MSHPESDEALIREWQAIAETLLENLPVDAALLRRAQSGSLEVVASAPDGEAFPRGERLPRDGSSCCDLLLSTGRDLAIGAGDADWERTVESRAGFACYIGTALRWPDSDDYGTLSVLSRAALDDDGRARAARLLQRLAAGATAQLGLQLKREQGHYEATHDALTGLPNRDLFKELAGMQMKVAQRNDSALWLVLWSIDDFQSYAHERGREALNGMLARVGERARSCIRQSDVLARLGDNQFAFMLAGANEFVANAVADRLRRNLSTLTAWPDHSPETVTASCGLSPYQPEESLEDWLARARAAVDDAASTGGNTAMVRDR
jgi:diguanylate cyclase (GGDEF)-like protein